ncbi:hypothetical protein G6F68_021159 [Rhizopus microsporus]|nr:hypothetical protein G6F68_021159 [Rhizopus microsporus]
MEMQTLFEAMRLLNISFEEESNKNYVSQVQRAELLNPGEPYASSLLEPLKLLWKDAGIQHARNEASSLLVLHDNAA